MDRNDSRLQGQLRSWPGGTQAGAEERVRARTAEQKCNADRCTRVNAQRNTEEK